MENKQQVTNGEQPQHWRSCKLIIDPSLTNGFFKVYRYDGQHFNMPVQDLGVFPVDTVRDPRICRLWTKYKECDLLVPTFKVDECYVGPIPLKEVTFARLNDNVREGFLTDMCKKYGQIEEVEIVYNPKNKKHLGIAKVIFDTVKAAKDAVQHLHDTSVMGNIIHVELDPKGENRIRYFQLLVSGLYTPWTLPVGSGEHTLQSLTERLLGSKPIQRLTDGSSSFCISSPTSVATPLSLDTAYSSMWQDTPNSFGQTPVSQGTPHTPFLSGTPLSQDSCYSSLQATPVSLGEHPSSYSVHRRSKRDVCYHQPGRPYGRSHRTSELSSLLKHIQPPPLLPLPSQTQAADNSYRSAFPWYQNTLPSAYPATEPPLYCPLPEKDSRKVPSPSSKTFPLSCSSASASIGVISVRERTETDPPDHHACLTEVPPSPPDLSPGAPNPETESHSLDSRIEMLLMKTQSSELPLLGERGLEAEELPQDSPVVPHSCKYSLVSTYSSDCTPALSPHPTNNSLEDVSPTPLPDLEEDIASLISTSQLSGRPGTLPLTHMEKRSKGLEMGPDQTTSDQKDMGRERGLHSVSFPKGLCLSSEDMDISDDQQSGTSIPKSHCAKGITVNSSFPSLPQPRPVPNLNCPISEPPSNLSINFCPPIIPFNLPIRIPSSNPHPQIIPSIPLIPICLSNGIIPIPPPGFRGMPPPPIPPPIALMGPPPPMVAPPSMLHPIYPYPLNGHHTFHGLPWPPPPMPKFNPSVPPPGYQPLKEDPHKVTVERVLAVIMEELKSIVKRDINRKMVEGVAFRAFDDWWNSQECKAKAAVTLGEGKVEELAKPRDPLRQNSSLRGATLLPSFKVKRKDTHDPSASERPKRVWSSAPVNVEQEDAASELDQGSDMTSGTLDKSRKDGSIQAVKRRHARPLELDSEGEEDEEEEEEESTGKVTDPTTDKEEDAGSSDNIPKDQLCDEDDDEEQKEEEMEEDEDEVLWRVTGGVQSSNEEAANVTVSDAESYTSEETEYLSDSSDSYTSEESEDSSDYDSSSDEDAEEDNREECVVISSDEELMELESPATPAAPLTPGTELELDLLERSKQVLTGHPVEERHIVSLSRAVLRHTSSLRLPDPVMELLAREHQQHLQASSPIGFPVVETDIELELGSIGWRMESPDNIGNLRPLTPTGSLGDSDSDLLFKSKPTPPAVEEVELPHTPGQGVAALVESDEYSMDQLRSLSPTHSDPLPQSLSGPPVIATSPYTYEDMPKTPGTDERSIWNTLSTWRVPVTPGRESTPTEGGQVMSPPPCSPFPFPLPSLSTSLRLRTPRTPGRGITSLRRTCRCKNVNVQGRLQTGKTPMVATLQRTYAASSSLSSDETLSDSPILISSPCSLSESSAETPNHSDVWSAGGRRKVPLRGLENRPVLVEKRSWRRVRRKMRRRMRRRRRMRQWQRMRSLLRATPTPLLSSPSPSLCGRPQSEEMAILHSIWREGIDEEDTRLLQATYGSMLQQHNGFSWLSDTLWIPHPLTRVLTEETEECNDWIRDHVTGSARSEGFYKISKKDKIKYLNNTRSTIDLPSTTTQGMNIPVQPQTSLRSGSEFRSEQRRLLSSFSCDSDLVKFNQLKFRKKRIRFCRSHIHDWGLFALEQIAADEMVIEYVGQTIRQVIADMREKRYEDEGIGSSYLFRVDQDTIIDATKCGNLARFINHSCNPNCYAKIITVESQKKIVIYSRQAIGVNEEITYDYKFPIEDEKIPCLCGAENCQGSLN